MGMIKTIHHLRSSSEASHAMSRRELLDDAAEGENIGGCLLHHHPSVTATAQPLLLSN